MKMILKPMIYTLLFITVFMSCNKEELFVEPTEEVVVTEDKDEDTDDEDTNNTAVDTSLPCSFTFESAQSGDTVIINCIMDLGGKSITLPSNITILYEGGDIINGTLNFSDNSVISGELLNATLIVGGTNPQLKDPTFNFIAKRWGIVEGIVEDDVATANKENIKQVISLVKKLGGSTFNLDNIDAYFEVSTLGSNSNHDSENSILIPSNFHFKMGENCNLRVQPNNSEVSALIRTVGTENIIISGGKLWGDRYTHNYNAAENTIEGRHGWGHLVMLKGVHNGVVDGVELHEATADGITISGTEHRLNDGSLKPNGRESKNVTVKNCLINDSRRNNIAITDGTGIYIEYNTIKNGGSGNDSEVVSSNGTSPRSGIDIEAFKNNAPDNNSVYEWQKTEDIHIRNNIFEDNYAVDIALYNGENTFVYENTFNSERAISAAYAYNNKIYNNIFERPEGLMSGSQAIAFEPRYWANGNHRIIGFEVYNNTFSGYQFAIVAGGQSNEFKDNTITDCQRGIILIDSKDLLFDNNTISSTVSDSYGYYTFSGETSVKNATIKNGSTNVVKRDLIYHNVNNDEVGNITVDNVNFNGGGVFLNSAQNITIKNSTFNDIKIIDCNPTLINNN